MNEREELLKKLNEDFEEAKKAEPVATYRATTNFNTALSNPQMTLNNNTNVNIQGNEGIDNSMALNNLLQENTNIPNQQLVKQQVVNPQPVNPQPNNLPNNGQTYEQVNSQNPVNTVNSDANLDVTERFYEEQPVYDMQTEYTKTYITNQDVSVKKKKTLKISKDTQVLILIIVIIFIFIMILPVLP